MFIHKRLLLIALGTAFVATACDKNPDNTTSVSASAWPAAEAAVTPVAKVLLPNACTLITASEAQALLGIELGVMSDEPENCLRAGGDNPGKITMFMVQLIQGETAAETETLFDSIISASDNINSAVNQQLGTTGRKSGQEIEGLGEAAWCSGSSVDLVGSQKLVTRSGSVIISFNITGMTKGERQASLCPKLEAAGRTALARLGGAK